MLIMTRRTASVQKLPDRLFVVGIDQDKLFSGIQKAVYIPLIVFLQTGNGTIGACQSVFYSDSNPMISSKWFSIYSAVMARQTNLICGLYRSSKSCLQPNGM